MMAGLSFSPLETPYGVFLVFFHSGGICGLSFPGTAEGGNLPAVDLPWPGLKKDLKGYLKGEKVDWSPYPLVMDFYPPFTRIVLAAVRTIPYGEVWTYREAAVRAGSPGGWRAAGRALGSNRHPLLVPCHRVVRSDGTLGGFGIPGGWKEKLLSLEGVVCRKRLSRGRPGRVGS